MPVYEDVNTFEFYYNPEEKMRKIYGDLGIKSILDVGAGQGGVFDFAYWTEREMENREACDLNWIRDMGDKWKTQIGVNVENLTDFYPEKSFDMVQCIETLEHVPNTRKALEELCKVARKFVFITSADETCHQGAEQEKFEALNPYQKYILQPSIDDLKELGFEVHVEHLEKRQIVAWKIMS